MSSVSVSDELQQTCYWSLWDTAAVNSVMIRLLAIGTMFEFADANIDFRMSCGFQDGKAKQVRADLMVMLHSETQ